MPELAGGENLLRSAAVLALVLIGIHNAWDTVTYVAVSQPEKADRS